MGGYRVGGGLGEAGVHFAGKRKRRCRCPPVSICRETSRLYAIQINGSIQHTPRANPKPPQTTTASTLGTNPERQPRIYKEVGAKEKGVAEFRFIEGIFSLSFMRNTSRFFSPRGDMRSWYMEKADGGVCSSSVGGHALLLCRYPRFL